MTSPTHSPAPRALPAGRFAIVVAAALVFVLILLAVTAAWPPLRAVDDRLAEAARDAGETHRWWIPLWQGVSTLIAPLTFRVIAAIALVVVWLVPRLRRLRLPVTVAAGTVILGGLLPVAIKALVDRPRPEAALVAAAQSSFPSAHAFGITVAALCAIGLARRGLPRRATSIAAGVLVVLVCGARVCLAVHYLSDVIAGAALGVVWVGVASVAARAFLSAGAGERAR